MTTAKWATRRVGKDVHTVPLDDLRPHKKNRRCWCEPDFCDQDGNPDAVGARNGVVVQHHAIDGREE